MEEDFKKLKNQRSVKTYSLNIIIISSIGFLFGLWGVIWFISKMGSPYINLPETDVNSFANLFNPKNYFLQSILILVITALLIISSYYVRKYSKKWRVVLQLALIAQIIFLIVTPIINISHIPNLDTNLEIWGPAKTKIVIWSVGISYLIAVYYLFALLKFAKEEIKRLFN